MTDDRKIRKFDFRRPSHMASAAERRFAAWRSELGVYAPEKWAEHLSLKVTAHVGHLGVYSATESLSQCADPGIGWRIVLQPDGPTTLLAMPRPLMLAWIMDLLGERYEEVPPDRPLTQVELSLAEALILEFVDALNESWPEQETLYCELRDVEPRPRRSRMFAPSSSVLLVPITVTCEPLGVHIWHWIIPSHAGEKFLNQDDEPDEPKHRDTGRLVEDLSREIPFELVVKLGEVTVSVTQLAAINKGDVLILDQRISEPIMADVAGRPKFKGWPGRNGSRQTFQIEAPVEVRSETV